MPLMVEFKIELNSASVAALEEDLAEWQIVDFMLLEDKPTSRAWLAGYFASASDAHTAWRELSPRIPHDRLKGDAVVLELPDQDWKESYKSHFKAWQFGRLHWVPAWEREKYLVPEGHVALWLDPGMAFGTGNHETTRLVVERLAKFVDRHGSRGTLIDAGCGSGILALSAAKLGYSSIQAFDNDPVAIEVSCANAAANGLSGKIDFFVGDLQSGLAGRKADLVLANIQADVLKTFRTELTESVAPGGALVLSGILAVELNNVREAFAQSVPAWTTDTRILGEWSDLVLVRP